MCTVALGSLYSFMVWTGTNFNYANSHRKVVTNSFRYVYGRRMQHAGNSIVRLFCKGVNAVKTFYYFISVQ